MSRFIDGMSRNNNILALVNREIYINSLFKEIYIFYIFFIDLH